MGQVSACCSVNIDCVILYNFHSSEMKVVAQEHVKLSVFVDQYVMLM